MCPNFLGQNFKRLIEDVNWNNFYPKHFSCLRHFKKLQMFTFLKKQIVFPFSSTKDVSKT